MKRFLVFTLEPYRLMVEAVRVHELMMEADGPGPGSAPTRGGGHVAWRGRLVPEIDLGALLGRPVLGHGPASVLSQAKAGTVTLVYGDDALDGSLVVFAADRVLGLRSLAAAELRPLPRLEGGLSRLFAGLFLDPADRRGILWLDVGADTLLDLARPRPAVLAP